MTVPSLGVIQRFRDWNPKAFLGVLIALQVGVAGGIYYSVGSTRGWRLLVVVAGFVIFSLALVEFSYRIGGDSRAE